MTQPSPGRLAAFCLAMVVAAFAAVPGSLAQNTALVRARRLFSSGDNEQAAHLLEVSLKDRPNDAESHLLLGQIYAIDDRRSDAIQQFTETLRLEPQSAVAYDTLGTALNRFAEFDQARKAFEQAVVLDPKLTQAHINLAMALAQAGETSGAIEQLHAAIGLGPALPAAGTAHYLLGKVYEQGDPPRAIDEMAAAVKIDPRNQRAWLALGELRSEANDDAAALAALKRAVACDQRDAESQYELGSEYLAQGDAKDAVLHLQLAYKAMPHPTLALLYKLDRALRRQGNTADAAEVRKQAQALIAQDALTNQHFQEAQTLDHDGVELEGKGDLEGALLKYRTALELNPQQDGFRLNYALALCRLNRWSQGIAELNEILERDPGNIEARRALFIAKDKAARSPEAQH